MRKISSKWVGLARIFFLARTKNRSRAKGEAIVMEVTVDRESLLLLLCDYLEKTGLIATLTALESEAELRSRSPGLTKVRQLALGGKWRDLEKALLLPSEERETHELFKKARFSLAKQRYLELVADLDEVSTHRQPSEGELDELQLLLETLERVSPSRDQYESLRALSEAPTHFFLDWNLQKARKETCNALLAWCRQDCCGGGKMAAVPGDRDIHQLTLLLVKGKMYEVCEEVFAVRCGSGEIGDKSTQLLDIGSWLQRQSDTVFQEAPRVIQLRGTDTRPEGETGPSGVTQGPLGQPQTREKGTLKTQFLPLAVPRAPPTSVSRPTSPPHTTHPPPAPNAPQSLTDPPSLEEKISEHRERVEAATDRLRESLREETREIGSDLTTQQPSSTPQQTTSPLPPPSPDSDTPPPPHDDGEQSDVLRFGDNFCGQTPPLQSTPHPQPREKRGRKSSTPIPAAQQIISSPPTSPVPHLPAGGLLATPSGRSQHGVPSERKQIDFEREASYSCRAEEETVAAISWPCATLVGKITDSQVCVCARV